MPIIGRLCLLIVLRIFFFCLFCLARMGGISIALDTGWHNTHVIIYLHQ